MLTQLLTLLENKENGLSLGEISRVMDAQPSAVASMLKLLVQKGRLAEIGPDGKCCEACELQSGCNLLAARGKRYVCKPIVIRSGKSKRSPKMGYGAA
jgi:hypothetical protein